MTPTVLSRRALLMGAGAALACRRPKATRYDGYCFVANQGGRSVAAVDLNTFRVRRQIPLDASPAAVLAHPAHPRALVLAPDAGTVYEVDAASLAVSRRLRAGNNAAGMRLSSSDGAAALWVLYRDPSLLVEVPLESFRPGRRIRLPAPGDDLDLSGDGRAAIVSRGGRAVSIVSLSTGKVERTVATAAEPSIARFRADATQVIVASEAGREAAIFDVRTGRTVVRLPLPVAPRNFCFTPDGGQLFVTGDGMDAVVIVFPYDTEIDQTILAGRAPDAMAIRGTPDNRPYYLLVSNPETNSVTVFDIDTRQLVAVVNVGQEPRQILITPDQQYALVLNARSGSLAVIRIAALSGHSQARFRSAPLFTLIPVGERPVSAAVVGFA